MNCFRAYRGIVVSGYQMESGVAYQWAELLELALLMLLVVMGKQWKLNARTVLVLCSFLWIGV
jgi:hypothetical protein